MYAGEVMKEKFENCLFRYRKLNDADREKNIDALKNNRLYFSTPVNFNDPYDNNGVVGYPRTLVEKRHAAQHSMALGVLKR